MSTRIRRRTASRRKGQARGRRASFNGSPRARLTLRAAVTAGRAELNRAALVAGLLGATVAWVLRGLDAQHGPRFGQTAAAHGAILMGALVPLALGIRVPQRFAAWLCTAAWQRFLERGRGRPAVPTWIDPTWDERPLRWSALAIITLLAGVTIALLPLLGLVVAQVYQAMMTHFLWLPATLGMLQAATVASAALVPLGALGVAVTMTHRLDTRAGRWNLRATGWMLVGAACGSAAAEAVAGRYTHPDPLTIAAALPVLAVSLISILAEGAGTDAGRTLRRPEPPEAPSVSDRWPAVLRSGVVAATGAGVLALSVWLHELESSALARCAPLPLLVSALGAGTLLAAWVPRAGGSMGSFGVACAVAGTLVGAVTGGGLWWRVLSPGDVSCAALAALWAALACTGFAVGTGVRTVLCRVANRSTVGTVLLTRIVVLGGLTTWVVGPLAEHWLGQTGAVALAALALLATGGIQIIYEPDYTPRARAARLGAVFAAIVSITLLLRYAPPGRRQATVAEPYRTPQASPLSNPLAAPQGR
ncbi:MAG TPA: hypothetical protein PKK06_12470 [Phycisphaerae bacterium]|nr:hypothetical protein [Phycisphaerae bacterium]HNU46443.1 hypothetical protein [Phycisphaerae bacterium]